MKSGKNLVVHIMHSKEALLDINKQTLFALNAVLTFMYFFFFPFTYQITKCALINSYVFEH